METESSARERQSHPGRCDPGLPWKKEAAFRDRIFGIVVVMDVRMNAEGIMKEGGIQK